MSKRIEPNIFEAAAFGLEERIITLVSENPDLVNEFAADGFTPLGLACYFNRAAAARILLIHEADVDLAARNGAQVAPIHSAVAANSLEISRLLLEQGANPDALQNGGMASALAINVLESAKAALAPAIFGPWMNVSGSVLATWWHRKPVANVETSRSVAE